MWELALANECVCERINKKTSNLFRGFFILCILLLVLF